MTLSKQSPFSKKVTDLPNTPSPIYSPTEIKEFFQTPADELMATHNNLVDELEADTGAEALGAKDIDDTPSNVQVLLSKTANGLKSHGEAEELDHPDSSVTTNKLRNAAVTRAKISSGAVGVNELDPTILQQPITEFGQQAKFQQLDEQLAENANHTKGSVNINEYAHLKVVIANGWDYTASIIEAINNMASGGELIFSEGTFYHTGISIPKSINVKGCGKYATRLVNISTNDAIVIGNNVERGSFKDLTIQGNGSLPNGTDATSGNGITFNNNSVVWLIENCWIRWHGGHGLFSHGTGHLNNINIYGCEIEHNKLDGIHFVSNDSNNQINAINIESCNLAGNSGNGISIWGSAINILNNTIQGNQKYGIDINSDHPTGKQGCSSISIEGNYFEKNKAGFIHGKANYVDANKYNYIIGLDISNNFGSQDAIDSDIGVTALVKFENATGSISDPQIRKINYANNNFGSADLKIADFNNKLGSDSKITWDELSAYPTNYIINMGAAKFNWLKEIVISGLFAKGVVYSLPQKSDNIANSVDVFFPLPIPLYSSIRKLGVFVETNSTNYSIWIGVVKKNKKTMDSYVNLFSQSFSAKSGSQYIETNLAGDAKLIPSGEDVILKISVTLTTPGTNFSLGNPCVLYS